MERYGRSLKLLTTRSGGRRRRSRRPRRCASCCAAGWPPIGSSSVVPPGGGSSPGSLRAVRERPVARGSSAGASASRSTGSPSPTGRTRPRSRRCRSRPSAMPHGQKRLHARRGRRPPRTCPPPRLRKSVLPNITSSTAEAELACGARPPPASAARAELDERPVDLGVLAPRRGTSGTSSSGPSTCRSACRRRTGRGGRRCRSRTPSAPTVPHEVRPSTACVTSVKVPLAVVAVQLAARRTCW